MNITPLSTKQNLYINKTQKANSNNYKLNSSVPCDTVSFGSAKSDKALKMLDGVIDDLVDGGCFTLIKKMKFHSTLSKAIPSIMTRENFINNGRSSKVYRISDKYVAKIKRGKYVDNAVGFFSVTKLPNEKFKDIEIYYGAPVAKVSNVEILRNAMPTKNHFRCGGDFGKEDLARAKINKYIIETFLPECNDVPQESFDQLALNLKKLNSKTKKNKLLKTETYYPDVYNPNNLIISDNKFVIVDDLMSAPVKNPNTIYTMLDPILVKLNQGEGMLAEKGDAVATQQRRNIFQKILKAGEKCELPLESPENTEKYFFHSNYSDFTIEAITDDRRDRNIIDELIEMRENGVGLRERLQHIDDFYKDVPVNN